MLNGKCWQLVIPNAKLVPEELRKIGKLTPLLYPVNQKTVFDFLYEQYNERCGDITIVCGEQFESVHQKLSDIGNGQVRVVNLPCVKDLAYTVGFGISGEESPLIINFSDTIVMENIFDYGDDCFFCSEDYPSDKWTFFEENDGVITEIRDKINIPEAEDMDMLFVGVFQFGDPQLLKKCLEAASAEPTSEISAFYRAVKAYSEIRPLKAIKTDKWFDIGHIEKYHNSSVEVKARLFNHISIDKNRGILRKTSDEKEKFIGEIQWYLKVPTDIEYVRPRIFSYSMDYANPYVDMEYYSYHTLHELFLYGGLTLNQWKQVFKRVKFICDDFKRYTLKDDNIRRSLEEMYLTKTLLRLEQIKSDYNFKSLFDYKFRINGITYKPLKDIVDTLKTLIPRLLYDVKQFNIIHGDLCFANIMIDSNLNFIKVIDPRGKFGEYDIYGDFRYELAKLLHSIDGKYDYIIKDMFALEYVREENELRYTVNIQKGNGDVFAAFGSVFKDELQNDLNKIYLIEALLFLSMIPLHTESLRHQYAMLATGITVLDRVENIKA